jgi:sodium-dependent phosphate cotransporter
MVVFMLDFFNDSYVAGGILALFILFVSIKSMSWIFKNTIQEQVVNNKEVLDTASDLKYLGTGLGLTFLIRSSSFTTSLIVPFVASKRIKLEKAFSFIIGANVGTTFTALLAALSGNNSAALAIALVHVLFNMIGAIIFFPNTKIRYVPIYLSNKIGEWSFENRMVGVAYVSLTFFVIPLLCYLIFG